MEYLALVKYRFLNFGDSEYFFSSYFRDTLRENIKISNIPLRLLLVVRFRDQYLQVPWPPMGLHQLCPLPELRSGVMQFQGVYFIIFSKLAVENQYPQFIIIRDRSRFLCKLGTFSKGQLISKCPFGVIVWTKIPTKKFDNFCPRI